MRIWTGLTARRETDFGCTVIIAPTGIEKVRFGDRPGSGYSPVKIMVLIPTGNLTGPMKGVLQLIEYSDPTEFDFRLYGFQSDHREQGPLVNVLRERGISVDLLDQKHRSYFSLGRQVVREIREQRFDLLQTHGFKPTFLGFFARLSCGVKWICFMHGTTAENLKVRLYNLVDTILQRGAHRTVLVSETQREKVVGGRNGERVRVLHNAIDPENPMPMSPNPQPVREQFAIPFDSKIIVTVGRFSPEKGMDVLLEAFALLVQRMDGVHLVLVGDGQNRSALERQAEWLGLDGTVHFAGYRDTPGDYVEEGDVFVLSSRSEGIPNAVLEAMALGTPVVATAVGGVPEIIEDRKSGYLAPSERPDLLAETLAEVLGDPEGRERIIVEGKRRVRESFSAQARVAKLQALYREILSGD